MVLHNRNDSKACKKTKDNLVECPPFIITARGVGIDPLFFCGTT